MNESAYSSIEPRDQTLPELTVRHSHYGEHRAECSRLSPNNPTGKGRLVAVIVEDGLTVWCRYCKAVHHIAKEECMAAWARGESATAQCARQEEQVS